MDLKKVSGVVSKEVAYHKLNMKVNNLEFLMHLL